VRSVGVYRGSFLDVGEYRAWVQAPPRSASDLVPPTQLREGDAELATRRLRSGGWVVLSRTIADRLDAHLGDIVRLPTPSPITVRVAGVSNNIGWPSGSILLNADDYAQAWDTTAASALHVRLEPDAVPERVVQEIRDALAPFLPAYVETSAERLDRHRESTRDGLARLSQITVLVLLSAMLAMAAAMAGMIWQRRPAFAGLKVHGYAEPELWRALLVEAGLLLGAGCLAGAVFGLCGQLLLTRALETITGFPVIYSTAGLVAAGILALVTTVAVAMLAIPGWLAVRVRPMPGGAT
jgi:putative ABC transport system permease protein